MVPDEWERRTYGEVSVINRENIPPSEDPDRKITYLDIGSVPELGRISDELDHIRFGEAPSRARRLVKDDDIVVSTVRPYLQGFARITDPPNDLVASTGFAVLTPTSAVTSEFLFQTVCSHRFLSQLESKMVGSNYPAVNIRDVRETTLLVPPLPEQKKIAAILSGADDAIAATRKVIEQTKRVKKGLLQDLMTRGIGHARFKKTEIGEIPEEWEVVPLSDVASVERGKFTARPRNDPKYYGGTVPFVQTGDVASADVMLASHSQTLNEEGLKVSRLFPAGTVLITIAANIGEVAEATYPVAFPDSLVGIQGGARVDSRWLVYLLETRRRHLNSIATQNAQKNINLRILRPLKIPVPELSEQKEIARRLDAISTSSSFSERMLGSLLSLKRGLMQDLLTGRVRVPVD